MLYDVIDWQWQGKGMVKLFPDYFSGSFRMSFFDSFWPDMLMGSKIVHQLLTCDTVSNASWISSWQVTTPENAGHLCRTTKHAMQYTKRLTQLFKIEYKDRVPIFLQIWAMYCPYGVGWHSTACTHLPTCYATATAIWTRNIEPYHRGFNSKINQD